MCTYVGYKAQPFFPAPDIEEYKLMDNPDDLGRMFDIVNKAFSIVGQISDDDLQKFIWEECVIGRGYYVVGPYICKVIDEEASRDVLIDPLLSGPLAFAEKYNAIASNDHQLQF